MKEIKHTKLIDVIPLLLSKLVLENGLEDLWRRENPGTYDYDRSSGTRFRIDRAYTNIKVANNTRIDHKISFSDHYNALIIYRLSSKTKIGNDLWHFNSSLLKKEDFCSTTKNMLSI